MPAVYGHLVAAGDVVAGFPILDYTPAGLLGLTILLILFGKLRPSSAEKPLTEEITFLRSANTKLQATVDELTRQNGELLETNTLVKSVFTALERAVE